MKRYMLYRHVGISRMMNSPIEYQSSTLLHLLNKACSTHWGKKHNYGRIKTSSDFTKTHPVVDYEQLRPMIQRMMHGEENLLWPGKTQWFAKSSGTTGNKSKFIPVNKNNLLGSHLKANWDAVSMYYANNPSAQLFKKKSLLMGGSLSEFEEHPSTLIGDISAIMLHNMPSVGRPFYTPDIDTALMNNWDEKIDRMVKMCSQEDITMLAGVPSWTLVLLKAILDHTGKSNIEEVWPNLELYFHGGVGFKPYRPQYKKLMPHSLHYLEIYNATEGFFAAQDTLGRDDMMLFLDNGIYYEFIPMEEWDKENPQTITLEEVEIGLNYSLVISTNAGLWRYKNGDTIRFTSTKPYRIQVTGRTQQFINVFGEELMIHNVERALSDICEELNAEIKEYTVGPIFMTTDSQGAHEWLIEYHKAPKDISTFAKKLDDKLQELNSDYEAKRYQDMTLLPLKINVATENTFLRWLRSKGKVGGQNKVPRLSNDRKILEDIMHHSNSTGGQ